MWQLKRFFLPYIWLLILTIVFLGVQAWANLALPNYLAEIVAQGIAKNNLNYIYQIGIKMILITFIFSIAAIVVSWGSAHLSASITRDLRQNIFNHVLNFSQAEFDKFSTASLITRSTTDIIQIQNFIGAFLRMIVFAPIMGIGGIILASQKASDMPQMAIIILIAVAIIISLSIFLLKIVVPRFEKIQKTLDQLNLVARESLAGMMVIRAFNNQAHESHRFGQVNSHLAQQTLVVNRLIQITSPVMTLIMNGIGVAVVLVGAHFVKNVNDVGNMMAFVQYATQIVMSFLTISMIFILWPRANVSAIRINEILQTKSSITDPPHPLSPPSFKEPLTVEFRDVSFRYPGSEANVLSHLSFTIPAAQTTAIIGSTGSGKSTLINLIPRLYDVTSGEILFNGQNIKNFTLHDLHKIIGFVPQKGILFSGTIASNLRYGDFDATEIQLSHVAGIAQATDFINQKPEKFNAIISQGGKNVSGGQKQRLAIARALITKAPLLIFDDSFSALDFKTDSALRHALAKETHHKTILIVAQRISTVINADQILVLNEGKIVGQGTHQELMKNCSIYQEIAHSQLSPSDLKKLQKQKSISSKKKGGY